MNAMTQERFGLVDLLTLVGTDLAGIRADECPARSDGATVSPSGSPVLSGASYVAALNGDPWRPRW